MAGERSERAPAQTLDQRLRALRQANEIRSRRAALKKDLASGRVRIEDVLAQPPAYAKTAKVQDLLLAVPKVGPARVARLLSQVSGGFEGEVSDIEIQAREVLALGRRLEEIIAERTGQPLAKVASDLERDYYMSSEEALAYGVIDRVIAHR